MLTSMAGSSEAGRGPFEHLRARIPPLGDPRIRAAHLDGPRLRLDLEDGRELAVPVAWFPWLERAMPAARARCEIEPGGRGVSWPELDEDVSVRGLLVPS